jgi:hypothetical protein
MDVCLPYRSLRLLGPVALVALMTGCAVGKALDEFSDVRIDYLRSAPFYKTYRNDGTPAARTGCAAIAVDPLTQREFPDAVAALQPLVAALNAHLDSECRRLADDPLLQVGMPEVYAGSSAATIAPPELRDSIASHAANLQLDAEDMAPQMGLVVHKPSKEWRAALSTAMQRLDVEHVLWIRLGLSEYPQTTNGFSKRVVLGTDHEQAIPLVSHFKDSVAVVHVTGVVLDREGALVRAGVEGVVGKPPSFCWSCVALSLAEFNTDKVSGVSHLTDAELQRMQGVRRTNVAGAPPTWQVALDQLVRQLTAS